MMDTPSTWTKSNGLILDLQMVFGGVESDGWTRNTEWVQMTKLSE